MWQYFLSYSIGLIVLYALGAYVMFSVMQPVVGFISSTAPEPDIGMVFGMMFRMMGVIALFLPVYLVFAAVFEASALRRYIRKDRFSLRFGSDEFRTMGVMLVWFGFWLLLYLIIAAPMLLAFPAIIEALETGGEPGPAIGLVVLTFPLMIIFGIVYIFTGVRFAPASALTLRDGKFTFLGAWKTTKGKFWRILGAYAGIYAITYIGQMAIQMVVMAVMMGTMFTNMENMENINPDNPFELLMMPGFLLPMGLMMIGGIISYAFMHFAFLGVSSHVALTDPDWQDNPSSVGVFD